MPRPCQESVGKLPPFTGDGAKIPGISEGQAGCLAFRQLLMPAWWILRQPDWRRRCRSSSRRRAKGEEIPSPAENLKSVRTDEHTNTEATTMDHTPMIPVGISGRHVHVSQEDLEHLFGPGQELTRFRELSQPGQFAANETVTLVGPKGAISRVRILGPVRKATQVEISRTDGYALGIDAPVRESGDLDGTPGIVLVGPYGPAKIEQGVIVAKRHIHFTPELSREFGVTDGEMVMVRTEGPRALVFDEVVVRVREDFALDMHVDTDEANAAGLGQGDLVSMVLKRAGG